MTARFRPQGYRLSAGVKSQSISTALWRCPALDAPLPPCEPARPGIERQDPEEEPGEARPGPRRRPFSSACPSGSFPAELMTVCGCSDCVIRGATKTRNGISTRRRARRRPRCAPGGPVVHRRPQEEVGAVEEDQEEEGGLPRVPVPERAPHDLREEGAGDEREHARREARRGPPAAARSSCHGSRPKEVTGASRPPRRETQRPPSRRTARGRTRCATTLRGSPAPAPARGTPRRRRPLSRREGGASGPS